jgi:hypothetical protein
MLLSVSQQNPQKCHISRSVPLDNIHIHNTGYVTLVTLESWPTDFQNDPFDLSSSGQVTDCRWIST